MSRDSVACVTSKPEALIMRAELLLAPDRLVPDDVEDGGLASRFHSNVSDVTSE